MKEKKAVALKEYAKNFKVVAKGRGRIAETIINVAREHKIPITRDEELVENLCRVELYEDIPPELYDYVVKVVEFIYNKKN